MNLNTIVSGFSSDEQRKRSAWEKAHPVLNYHPDYARRDDFGWYILWSEYGNRQSPYGWEIDHAFPSALGGGDSRSNLRALHWRINAGLGGRLGAAFLTNALLRK